MNDPILFQAAACPVCGGDVMSYVELLRESREHADKLAALLAEVEATGVLIDGNVFVNYDLKDRIRALLRERAAPRQASNSVMDGSDQPNKGLGGAASGTHTIDPHTGIRTVAAARGEAGT